jgi:hypothetical protein
VIGWSEGLEGCVLLCEGARCVGVFEDDGLVGEVDAGALMCVRVSMCGYVYVCGLA